MGTLTPVLSVLPAAQRHVWDQLGPTPREFVLYGGAALALRLGHRRSIMFDLFSAEHFEPLQLQQRLPCVAGQTVTRQAPDTLSCEVDTPHGKVQLLFLGGLAQGQIDPPDVVASNGIAVAALRDLFGARCAAIAQRRVDRDYLDIHALVHRAGIPLDEGIACARAMYGGQYSPETTLQALARLDELPEPLPAAVREELLQAVRSVSLDRLPARLAAAGIGAARDGA